MADWVSFAVVVNLGGLLLQALLEYWPRTHINPMDEETELNHGKWLLACQWRETISLFVCLFWGVFELKSVSSVCFQWMGNMRAEYRKGMATSRYLHTPLSFSGRQEGELCFGEHPLCVKCDVKVVFHACVLGMLCLFAVCFCRSHAAEQHTQLENGAQCKPWISQTESASVSLVKSIAAIYFQECLEWQEFGIESQQ